MFGLGRSLSAVRGRGIRPYILWSLSQLPPRESLTPDQSLFGAGFQFSGFIVTLVLLHRALLSRVVKIEQADS